MPSFDYTVDMERKLLRLLTGSPMMARMYLHRASEAMFTSNERKFVFGCATKALEDSRSALTRTVFEYEVASRVPEAEAAYYLSEWNLIEGLEAEEQPDILIDRISAADVGRKALSLAEDVVGMLEKGEISEAVAHLKRESMLIDRTRDDRPTVELTDYQRRIDLIADKRAHPEKYLGIRTGFRTYDRKTGGLYKGEMLLLAGITGLGKSTACKQVAKNIVELNPGRNVLHIANEEYLEQVESKYDAVWSEVPYQDFKKATISDEDFRKWAGKMEALRTGSAGRLFVKEVPAFTDVTLIERAYRELENLGVKIDVIVIDHLPHVVPVQKAWGENDERAKAASEVKELARWLHVAVVVPAQAATAVEEKSNKGRRANKLDVYGSKGQIHVSNVFLILTWKCQDESQTDREPEDRDVFLLADIKKNRDGPPFHFFLKHTVRHGAIDEVDENAINPGDDKSRKGAADEAVKEAEDPVGENHRVMEMVETGGAAEDEAPAEADRIGVVGAVDGAVGEAGEAAPAPEASRLSRVPVVRKSGTTRKLEARMSVLDKVRAARRKSGLS